MVRQTSAGAGILWVCLLFSPGSVNAQSGTQWSPYLEWTVENSSYAGNPFDVIAAVTFLHTESSETRTTPMFYDSLDTWKFRFTGTRTGVWTYLSASPDPDLDNLSGSLTIHENPDVYAHGFIKNFGNKWGWQGTETAFIPQLVMFSNPYYLHPDNNPGAVEDGIQTFLVEHGFSGFHVRVALRWFAFQDTTANPDNLGDDPNPDIKMFEAIENLIVKTHAAGGMVHFWQWGDGVNTINPWGKGSAVDLRLQRYIAGRLGPLPGWSMGYGYDVQEWANEAEVHAWHDSMQSRMGWPHFLGARPQAPQTPESLITHADLIPWNADLDYSSYEHWRPSYDVYREALNTITTQPVMSEDRFRIRNSPYPEKDYTELMTIRGLYTSALAGGAANIWGNLLPAAGPGYASVPYDSADCILAYSRFFKDRFFADMTECNELTDGWGLKRPNNCDYIFYTQNATSIRADLSGAVGPRFAIVLNTLDPNGEIELGWLEAEDQTLDLSAYGPATDWIVAAGFGCGLETRVWLQGAFDSTNTMCLDLNAGGILPFNAPYNEAQRIVDMIPAGVVDWILVQLRETAEGDALYSQSAFLNHDGRIVADDGETGRIFLDAVPGDYYLVLQHRNHMSVMSADKVRLE